jgi:hypothetical protein
VAHEDDAIRAVRAARDPRHESARARPARVRPDDRTGAPAPGLNVLVAACFVRRTLSGDDLDEEDSASRRPQHATPHVRTASLKDPGLLKERVEDHLFEKQVHRELQCVNGCEVVSRDNDNHVDVG